MVTEAINTAVEAGARPENILVRGDSAFCAGKTIAAIVKAGGAILLRRRPQPRRRRRDQQHPG